MADIIDELKALDDAALAKKLGFADKVAQFKKDMDVASTLKGEARQKVVSNMTRIFGPDNYELQDISRTIQREANPKEDEAAKFVASCGCCDMSD